MSHIEQFHDPDLSLWQSAVDEVVAKRTGAARSESVGGPTVIQRPDTSDQMVHGAVADLKAETSGITLQAASIAGPAITQGVGGFAEVCSKIARDLAWAKIRGDDAAAAALAAQFQKFGQCDGGWLEVAAKYEEFQLTLKLNAGKIPYQTHKSIDDFVIDGRLPDNASIGIVGDWGTGQDAAKQVLAQMAAKPLDAAIHLGDIYYSCTDFEVQNYFLQIWQQHFDVSKVASFTLSGNHDMYGGGVPYYKLLNTLGQPASYCCVRNDHWQFVMIDTGLHDRTPGGVDPTFLEDSELAWLKRRIATAGGRKTVLLSHHQLFTRFSNIIDPPPVKGMPGLATNDRLLQQIGDILPEVTLWLWGHEHDFVVYKQQSGILARCVGHGGVPVLIDPPPVVNHPEIAAEDVRPDENGNFFTHGYAIMELSGANATVKYYQDTDPVNPMWLDNL